MTVTKGNKVDEKIEGLSLQQYGDRVQVSRQRVHGYIKAGQISKAAIIQRGKRIFIRPDIADADLRRTLDPAKSLTKLPEAEKRETIKAAGLDVDAENYQQSRALNEYYKAALRKLEYDAKAGDLVPKQEVEKEAFECARTCRTQC